MPNKKKLIVANWKMNPLNLEEAKKIFNPARTIAKNLKNTNILICPPFPYLFPLSKLNSPKNLFLGAQNISSEEKGAFTGEVSASQIKDLGVSFCIIGHSERRKMGETNEIIKKKLEMALYNNLTPILCIGEKTRDKDGSYLSFLKSQLKECLTGLQKKDLLGFFIAYEPIWAIGKSYKESMNPTDIHETSLFIKKSFGELFGRDMSLNLKILYGGSVEPENASLIAEYGDIDGFLVGHASLVPEKFKKILEAADIKR